MLLRKRLLPRGRVNLENFLLRKKRRPTFLGGRGREVERSFRFGKKKKPHLKGPFFRCLEMQDRRALWNVRGN